MHGEEGLVFGKWRAAIVAAAVTVDQVGPGDGT